MASIAIIHRARVRKVRANRSVVRKWKRLAMVSVRVRKPDIKVSSANRKARSLRIIVP